MVLIVEDQQPVPSGDMELQLVKEREMSEETTEKVDTTTKSSDTTALDQTEKEIEPVCISTLYSASVISNLSHMARA